MSRTAPGGAVPCVKVLNPALQQPGSAAHCRVQTRPSALACLWGFSAQDHALAGKSGDFK